VLAPAGPDHEDVHARHPIDAPAPLRGVRGSPVGNLTS
jgi:hypothetical protein